MNTDKREPYSDQCSHYDIAALTKTEDRHVVILASNKSNGFMAASRYSLLMIEQTAMLRPVVCLARTLASTFLLPCGNPISHRTVVASFPVRLSIPQHRRPRPPPPSQCHHFAHMWKTPGRLKTPRTWKTQTPRQHWVGRTGPGGFRQSLRSRHPVIPLDISWRPWKFVRRRTCIPTRPSQGSARHFPKQVSAIWQDCRPRVPTSRPPVGFRL